MTTHNRANSETVRQEIKIKKGCTSRGQGNEKWTQFANRSVKQSKEAWRIAIPYTHTHADTNLHIKTSMCYIINTYNINISSISNSSQHFSHSSDRFLYLQLYILFASSTATHYERPYTLYVKA